MRDDIQGGVLATLIRRPAGGCLLRWWRHRPGRDHRCGWRMDQRRWRPGSSHDGSRCGTDLAQPSARAVGKLRAGRFGKAARAMSGDPSERRLLITGIVGTVIAALCCFTPVLAVLLGFVGLSALLGWLDVVLLPALAVFIGLTIYALWRRQRNARNS